MVVTCGAIYLMYSSFKKNAILLCIILINLYLCNRENKLSMSKEQSNIVEYLVCVIGAFAKQFSLTGSCLLFVLLFSFSSEQSELSDYFIK